MDLLTKLKETVVSVLPVMVIVLLLGFTIVPIDKIIIYRFIIGGLLLILGLTIFLQGVNLGIQPMGERSGAELTQKRNLLLLLTVSFLIGFIVTIAEPDIQVFGSQVQAIFTFINKNLLTVIIGLGVGLFVMLGLLRSVLNISIKISLLICYVLLFAVAFLVPDAFTGIAFDSGGATTGPMTVPFIMALGIGVSATRGDSKNSFGLTGIASVGPVLAVLVYALVLKLNGTFTGAAQSAGTATALTQTAPAGIMQQIFEPFGHSAGHVLKESLFSIAPLLLLFVIFQFTLLKMTARQVTRIIIGFVYSFIGLYIFLLGVNGGFMQAGAALGNVLGQKAVAEGGWWFALLLITGLILGAIIVCAEPAVWVLSEQVESVSGGTIKRKILLIFLSTGTAIAIGLAMLRAVYSFNLKWILVPGYVLAMILMIFSPDIFTGIAFDSGGVASGPLTSTFVLSFTLGASSGGSGALDSFGVIALVAMMPLIAIQLMGIIVKIKQSKHKTKNLEVEA